ncbi:hypothetical protein CDAR_531061 [Caerostris darwini]|uniref:Uncharacterized protein n=1 Tax=Caerostris darwini TaxID=1538125 RepID=A0AAV4VUR1_9ARAC|nr:hypothetical protein CDAR_531061 [Caerostris darwini]
MGGTSVAVRIFIADREPLLVFDIRKKWLCRESRLLSFGTANGPSRGELSTPTHRSLDSLHRSHHLPVAVSVSVSHSFVVPPPFLLSVLHF